MTGRRDAPGDPAARSGELEALDAIGRLASSVSDRARFLEETSRIVEAVTRCTSVGVYMFDEATGSIGLIHQRGLAPEVAKQVARAPVLPPAIFTRPDPPADVVSPSIYPARFQPFLQALGVRALARIPLLVGARVIGELVVAFSGAAPEEAEAHLRFLRPLGSLMGAFLASEALEAELRRTQAQLLQRERLAALGALSAAVAHEVRNPLGVIFNAIGMLRRHRTMDEEGRGLVGIVAEEAERLNRIVTDLLGFARPSPAVLRSAALGPIVEEAVRAALAGQRVPAEVTWELAPDLPPIEVDAGLVRQALINLVLNALQAMPRGGRLQVRTTRAGAFAVIELTDSGPGIPEELRERIFEPFFTTRTSGTGLGLAIVKHVVGVHGGAVDVSAGPEGGTRFTLRFPLSAAQGPAPTLTR